MQLINKRFHALIRMIQLVLNVENPTFHDKQCLKEKFEEMLSSGMSPTDIKNHYKIQYSDFGMFLKKSLDINLLDHSDAVNNYYRNEGRSVTDEKSIYQKQCDFLFDPYSIPSIPGYELLLEKGMYHSTRNKNGATRDHIISVEYGWRNKIDPSLLSHPANCQFITNINNIKKGSSCGSSLDDLLRKIQMNVFEVIQITYRQLPKTTEHKQKISETNKKYMLITNEIENKRILKTDPIPEGWRRGFIRKMVRQDGFEPTL